MTTFTDLGLCSPLLKALASEGYENPTPIQAQAIPGVMAGRDLLGIAQTGTGKTAAFALPILHRLAADRKPAPKRGARVLVLSPTRELATQIAESFKTYGKHLGFTTTVVFGGAKYGPQIKALAAGVDVLVATPGRLIDHLGEKTCQLAETEILVLDEADQMLDLGFLQPIRRIVSHLPKIRQNLFFSATMPTEIGKLAGELLKEPLKVSVAPTATTAERVDQRIIFVEADYKRELLAELFADAGLARTIVFTRTKRGADRVAKHLEGAGVTAASIHGDKSQSQRERALAAFKAGACRALVATDIAARGIDIDSVTHVINFELPYVPEAYVHRIGRTARAGASGQAISLCADDERPLVRDIQRVTRQTIPAEDRRRDPALRVMAKATAEMAASRGETQGRRDDETRGDGGRRDGANRGGGRGRPAGGGQGAGRNHGGGQAAGHAPRGGGQPRREGQGQGRGGPGVGQAKPASSAQARPQRWHPLDS
jgi:ATP-dependent RNA helicase RhlE